MSIEVEFRPNEKRRVLSASPSERPMALRTGLTLVRPLWQAEPRLMANSVKEEGTFEPTKVMFKLLCIRRPMGGPLSRA